MSHPTEGSVCYGAVPAGKRAQGQKGTWKPSCTAGEHTPASKHLIITVQTRGSSNATVAALSLHPLVTVIVQKLNICFSQMPPLDVRNVLCE